MSREVNQWFWIQNGPQTSIQWVVGLCQSQRIWRQKQKHVMLFFSVVGAESVERLPGGEQANCQGKHSTFPSLISFCTYSDHILQISHWTVTVIRLVSFVVYFFQWELVEFCNHHKKVKETVKASHFHCGWKKKPQKTSVTSISLDTLGVTDPLLETGVPRTFCTFVVFSVCRWRAPSATWTSAPSTSTVRRRYEAWTTSRQIKHSWPSVCHTLVCSAGCFGDR